MSLGLDALRAAIDLLLAEQSGGADKAESLRACLVLEAEIRRLPAVQHRTIAALLQQLPGDGAAELSAVLASELRITRADAAARVRAAQNLGPRRGLTGEALPPLFGRVAAAQADGLISSTQAATIVKAVDQLPDVVAAELDNTVEQILVDAAVQTDPTELARFAAALVARLDPDGTEPVDEAHHRKRFLRLQRHRDGSSELSGYLTPETTAVWTTLLDAASAPQPATTDGDGKPERDPRTPIQRQHDGFLDLGLHALRTGDNPTSGGIPVTILATITQTQLAAAAASADPPPDSWPAPTPRSRGPAQAGYATTAHGDLLSIAHLLGLIDDAHIIPTVLSDTGAVLSLGRTKRLATTTQRLALAARDHGCSFPGCTRPPAWTQTHHVISWLDGGPTDLTNMTLVCGHHHRNFARQGWTCHITNGLPEWTPPTWIDKHQTPRRNATRHAAALLTGRYDELLRHYPALATQPSTR